MEGDDHREAYAAIERGELLSRERVTNAKSEAVGSAEGAVEGTAAATSCSSVSARTCLEPTSQIRDAFYGDADDWKGMVAGQSLLAVKQALAGLAG